jgi:hypothetical protein
VSFQHKPDLQTPPYRKPGVCRICKEPYTKTSPRQKTCSNPACRKEAKAQVHRRCVARKRRSQTV